MKSGKIQVEKGHYDFSKYVGKGRWMSYYYQIKEMVDSGAKSFLVIGKGDGLVPHIVEQIIRGGVVDTFDFDENLSPTYIGDIRNLCDIVKKEYDCIVCCQVLEHIEWKHFERVIKQINSICSSRVIISLPVYKLGFSIFIDFPRFHNKSWNIIIPRFWRNRLSRWNGEHYWEVGIKNHTQKDVLKVLERRFELVKEYFVPENTYHWFIILNSYKKEY